MNLMTTASKSPLCPSSPCQAGARLLGIVQKDGTVAFTPDDLRIDTVFVQIASRGRKPESRFRFASPCKAGKCAQWTQSRCGVIDAVLAEASAASPVETKTQAPDCAIRPDCRWFAQRGMDACLVCSFVITDLDESGVSQSMTD